MFRKLTKKSILQDNKVTLSYERQLRDDDLSKYIHDQTA